MSRISTRLGLTAIEVLASTVLASLLMVAVLGVLRGLRAQEAALDLRLPVESWQSTLNSVLQQDLENSRTYELRDTALILNGLGGRDSTTGAAIWQPAVIAYAVVTDGERSWLVRREAPANGEPARQELMLAGVTEIHAGSRTALGKHSQAALSNVTRNAMPVRDGFTIEFHSASEGLVHAYRFHRY